MGLGGATADGDLEAGAGAAEAGAASGGVPGVPGGGAASVGVSRSGAASGGVTVIICFVIKLGPRARRHFSFCVDADARNMSYYHQQTWEGKSTV